MVLNFELEFMDVADNVFKLKRLHFIQIHLDLVLESV
jgi:hypothetical protein